MQVRAGLARNRWARRLYDRLHHARWVVRRQGKPSHLAKERLVRQLASRFRHRVFIETGTYRGDMLAAVADDFDHLVSVEIDADLFTQARRRFAGRSKVQLLLGDSGTILPEVLRTLSEPAIFWLDAHYSGGETSSGAVETPVRAEIAQVLSHPYDHIVLIDDVDDLGTGDYPTLAQLEEAIRSLRPEAEISVSSNVLVVLPGSRPRSETP